MVGFKTNGKKTLKNSLVTIAKQHHSLESESLTANPGDRIVKERQSLEEKSKQMAVDAPDITGDWIKVPTYFIFEYPNGEKKALHHVRDAKEISDAIRIAQFEADDALILDRERKPHNVNLLPLILVILLFVFTLPVLIGVF